MKIIKYQVNFDIYDTLLPIFSQAISPHFLLSSCFWLIVLFFVDECLSHTKYEFFQKYIQDKFSILSVQ
jgi:hypothetical protein